MLFLIIVIVLYIFLENIFKINLNDGKHKKLLKLGSIVGLSAVMVNLIYDKSLLNVIFVCLLIYIVSNTRKDSLYEYMSNIDNFENEYSIDSDYYKFYRNKEDSLSRVFNDEYEENHYSLDNLYPKENDNENEDEDENQNDEEQKAQINAEYNDELENIKKSVMNKFWLIDNNNTKYKLKEEQICSKTSKPSKMITKQKPSKPPKTGICYLFDKIFGLFL